MRRTRRDTPRSCPGRLQTALPIKHTRRRRPWPPSTPSRRLPTDSTRLSCRRFRAASPTRSGSPARCRCTRLSGRSMARRKRNMPALNLVITMSGRRCLSLRRLRSRRRPRQNRCLRSRATARYRCRRMSGRWRCRLRRPMGLRPSQASLLRRGCRQRVQHRHRRRVMHQVIARCRRRRTGRCQIQMTRTRRRIRCQQQHR